LFPHITTNQSHTLDISLREVQFTEAGIEKLKVFLWIGEIKM